MRIAIISTPRSGNTWLRFMLSALYNAQQSAIHSPDDLDWDNLPSSNFVLQLHWHRTSRLKHLLIENNFKIVVLQRHPLDILLSILQFAHQEPQTIHWLNGEGGDEKVIYGKSPGSEAFLEYAIGQRARALLSISNEWCHEPEATIVRYEDLVNDTEKTLYELTNRLGAPQLKIFEVVNSNRIDKLRLTSDNGHFWQGKPGLWKKLIPSIIVEKIVREQNELFSELGYDFQPSNTRLMPNEAESRWESLCQ